MDNDTILLEITGLTHMGEGVGRDGGKVIFVPGALPGELIQCRLEHNKKSFGRARLESIVKVASGRIVSDCPDYGFCGGCQLLHADYQEQLRLKTGIVQDALKRLGDMKDPPVRPMLGVQKPFNYRNKVVLHVGKIEGKLALGFYGPGTHSLIAMKDCQLMPRVFHSVASRLVELLNVPSAIPVEEGQAEQGKLERLILRLSDATEEMIAVLVTKDARFDAGERLAKALMEDFPALVSVALSVNSGSDGEDLEGKTRVLAGKSSFMERIGPFKFRVSPTSFLQVNPEQTQVLYNQVMEYAAVDHNHIVFDVYCGVGTISLFLAAKANRVYGIESSRAAVRDARHNTRLNGIDNAAFFQGEAEKVLTRLYSRGISPQVVVLDPPRTGCKEEVLQELVNMMPKRIVYVSCNPATLARDLKFLKEKGNYTTTEVQPVDMFPHTSHVECVVLIERK
ncbi:MAG: 23S rRNA (uracil(1939)-C(5))-methyltransferase RlmD [Bacillota bacterium]